MNTLNTIVANLYYLKNTKMFRRQSVRRPFVKRFRHLPHVLNWAKPNILIKTEREPSPPKLSPL
jgi:hypothetical protein